LDFLVQAARQAICADIQRTVLDEFTYILLGRLLYPYSHAPELDSSHPELSDFLEYPPR
jgi:hypothetical protein